METCHYVFHLEISNLKFVLSTKITVINSFFLLVDKGIIKLLENSAIEKFLGENIFKMVPNRQNNFKSKSDD